MSTPSAAASVEDATALDLHHLCASYRVPCEAGSAALTAQGAKATQLLVGGLFGLPVQRSDAGPIARLPPGVTPLPREKRLPEQKETTKWQAFAKEKGISKKKTSRMAWDEREAAWDRDKWAPQWGYDRAGGSGEQDAPIIELKGDDIMADPREAARLAKKARTDKNAKQRAGNDKRAKKLKGKDDSKKVPEGIPTDLPDGDARKHRGKDGVAGALKRAQIATASLGKFDAMAHGEKARAKVEDRAKGRKRAFLAVAGAKGADEARAMDVLSDLQRPRASRPKKGERETMDTHDFEAPNEGKKRKKGKAGGGKATKVTKKRAK